MTKQSYLVNKTDTHLQLKRGFLHVPRNGYKAVSAEDLEHPDIAYAKERDWVYVTDEKPADAPAAPGPVVIDNVVPYQGMTSEELVAEREKEATVDAVPSAPADKPAEGEAEGETAVKAEAPAAQKKGRGKTAA